MELHITGLTAQGAGVGRNREGLAVFVPGALPGEVVIADITRRNKNYAQGVLREICRASSWRVEPACQVHANCGGCPLLNLAYAEQLLWKQRWVEDALRRIGGIDAQVLPTLPSPRIFGYRSRGQLHVLEKDNRLQLGFYRRGSREGMANDHCLLLNPLLRDIAQMLNKALPQALRHIALRCDSRGERALITLVGLEPEESLRKLALQLMEEDKRIASLWANWGRRVYGIYGDSWCKLAGADKLPDEAAHLRLAISPAAFTQVNQEQAVRLYQLIAEYADLQGQEILLDVYSGVGIIGLYLAAYARQVIGVENYGPATADAEYNARLNKIENCSFINGAAENILPSLQAKDKTPYVVVADPPRAGCATPVIDSITRIKPRRLVYVSCDPATLARDLALYMQAGYVVKQVQPVDMFPHTGHVETVVLLSRKTPNDVIHVDLELDEMDVTAAEAKATYQEIKDYVLDKFGLKVSQLYIAQVKRKHGIIERENYNTGEGKAKVPQVPADKETAIEDALRHFDMI